MLWKMSVNKCVTQHRSISYLWSVVKTRGSTVSETSFKKDDRQRSDPSAVCLLCSWCFEDLKPDLTRSIWSPAGVGPCSDAFLQIDLNNYFEHECSILTLGKDFFLCHILSNYSLWRIKTIQSESLVHIGKTLPQARGPSQSCLQRRQEKNN